jgi:C-terminal processing protease CtpA/Prc
VVDVAPGSPAARAGLRIGYTIESINGAPPRRFEGLHSVDLDAGPRFRLVIHRPGRAHAFTLTFVAQHPASGAQCNELPRGRTLRWDNRSAGYLELPVDCGTEDYASVGQALIRSADRGGACGWVLDLRNNDAGDIWSYLAAIGPILRDGRLGGFVYPDGRRETWAYRRGKVLWNGQARPESTVAGGAYHVRRAMPPIAVLTSGFTSAAGELADVALRGRPHTRFIGEPTQGFPTLTLNTPLSDGALLLLSGAFSFDRTGRTYNGPIRPETQVSTDWARFGSLQDPPIQAALRWLQRQPSCAATPAS